MEHVLDNPAWNALISGNRDLSYGNERVRYFDREVSPFVGLKDNSEENFRELYDIIPHNYPVLFVTTKQIEAPAQWKLFQLIKGLQMVYEGEAALVESEFSFVPLTSEHVPQMLALTQLTNPGPFGSKTIAFGHYHGVFEEDKLVAMAGQRMHAFEYAEISAVCTHPRHTGKGYARQLLLHQIARIKAASNIPYLHVKYDNERAISVYKDIGFSVNQEVYFHVLAKNDEVK